MSDQRASKRKAADDLQLPSKQRACLTSLDTQGNAIKPTSILSILRANCRERLYVKPIAWISRQLRHLDCKFAAEKNPQTKKDRPPQSESQDPNIPETRRSRDNLPTARTSSDLLRAMTHLPGCRGQFVKKLAIRNILSLNTYLSISVVSPPQRSLQKNHINGRPCGFDNYPVIRIRNKHLRLIKPHNPAEDPYIMAMLIALAQEQRRRQQDADSQHRARTTACQITQQDDNTAASCPAIAPICRNPDQSFKVNVLAISGARTELLYVYTANISAEFLNGFDEPSCGLPSLPIVATYRCIPLKSRRNAVKMLHGLVCAGSLLFLGARFPVSRSPTISPASELKPSLSSVSPAPASSTRPTRVIVAMTGATGAILGIRPLERLRAHNVETHLIINRWATETIKYETRYTIKQIRALTSRTYPGNDAAAAVASGSFQTDAMVIVPCSMRTLSAVRTGFADDLICRAADVTLKEKRRLVLVVRETPLSCIHLENMLTLARYGAVIFPPVPAFYTMPEGVEDMVTQSVGRMMDMLGLETDGFRRGQVKAAKKRDAKVRGGPTLMDPSPLVHGPTQP
ncbi:UbiX family flavin prenyltransferase [Aspergillus affinis]|uniref:UbiX family flavin prenyltransferase n=1 Tax=Aspergillus affinis TaxID=1070780 RepID=UPI0022FEDA48|nr:Phenylacrylic acid decarboxylase [Aspergillus affinis]KAI9040150.1 Phenylacrylic acid decarboxylase [Aspergillus affinis]